MAFITVFVSFFMVVLIWKGQALRERSLVAGHSEDGIQVVTTDDGRPDGVGSEGNSVSQSGSLPEKLA